MDYQVNCKDVTTKIERKKKEEKGWEGRKAASNALRLGSLKSMTSVLCILLNAFKNK